MYRETANPALSTVTLVDPYFYHTLRSLQGKPVVIETSRGPVRGTITDAFSNQASPFVFSAITRVNIPAANGIPK
ncbi:DUF2642 domain-containing protein [Paenibacillus sp. PastF-3]|uniref:DUF2642 domain-containing protein n=1 Tax=Paenibacillus sp. PastF-3 TaxID=2940626 RepID=UPI0032AEAE7B